MSFYNWVKVRFIGCIWFYEAALHSDIVCDSFSFPVTMPATDGHAWTKLAKKKYLKNKNEPYYNTAM